MQSKMKQLFGLLLFLCTINVSAQDVIVKKDGSTIVCRVLEVNSSEIIYKKWTDLQGAFYVMNRADASAINYESGKKEEMSGMTNLYTPNNQNDGMQQFNDRVLLQIDYATHKKARKLRTIGLVGGGVFLGIGAALVIIDNAENVFSYIAGGAGILSAIAWTSGFYIAAHNVQKQANKFQSFNIYQQEFKFKNGTSLTPSIDLMKDQSLNSQTIGLGLSYNF